MKFEQALKAIRRGEKVRRKSWPRGQYIIGEGEYVKKGEVEWDLAMALLADDWVIVRKKKPELRDVFKNPKVGDVIGTKGTPHQWVVIGVDARKVWFWATYDRTDLYQTREEWAEANTYKVLHRAP